MYFDLSDIIKKSIKELLLSRYDIYGYFDISYLLSTNKDNLLHKIEKISLNKQEFYDVVFKEKKDSNYEKSLEYQIKYIVNNVCDEKEFYELVLIYIFKNIKSLVGKGQIEIKHEGPPLFTEEEVLKAYIDNKLVKMKNNGLCYNSEKIIPKLINSLNSYISIPLENCYFRGHSSINYNLLPSIYREKDRKENHYFNNTLKEYPDLFINKTNIDKLSIMQHNGVFTRLLDITKNPLVALYFASISNMKELGEVVVFSENKSIEKYANSDSISILSALPQLKNEYYTEIVETEKDGKEFNDLASVGELIHFVSQERNNFIKDAFKKETLFSCYIYKANRTTERIIRQNGLFFICGVNKENSIEKLLNSYRKKDNEKYLLLLIDKKEKIIKDLNNISINDHNLFPEISNYMKTLKED